MDKKPSAKDILRQEESKILEILGQMPMIMWATDRDLRVTMSLGAGLAALGLVPNQVNGASLFGILQTKNRHDLPIAAHLQALQGEPSGFEFHWEGRVYHTHVEPIRDTQGVVTGVLGFALDITERKKGEEILKKRAEQAVRFQNVLLGLAKMEHQDMEESLKKIAAADAQALEVERVSIWCFNDDRLGIDCYTLYKLSEDIFEKGVHLEAKDYPLYFQALEESRTINANDAHRDPRTKEFSESYLKPLGISSMMDVPIRLGGQIIGIVCHEHVGHKKIWSQEEQDFAASIADMISLACVSQKRREAEEALKKTTQDLIRSNKELEQFAYVTSHDLQEPLHKIIAFGDRIQTLKEEDSRREEFLKRMQRAAGQMRQLINDLLQFARITTRKRPFETLELEKVVREVLSDLDFRLTETKAKVEVGSLPQVHGDPLQIRQLFQNLLSNALKFTLPGQAPRVQILAKQTPEGTMEIQIRDEGIGFNEEFLKKIFQPFQRLNPREDYEGSGMGLALCQKIVQRHGGELKAQSEEGKGATFIIRLPSPAHKS